MVNHAQCHPDQPAYGNGLCKKCYGIAWHKRRGRKVHRAILKLEGKVFGRLTVLRQGDHIQTSKYSYVGWLCQCQCGKCKTVRSDHLRAGYVKSCGCLKADLGVQKARQYGSGGVSGSFWSTIRYAAQARKIRFEITAEEAWKLFERQHGRCALSGVEITMPESYRDRARTASLDRIESNGHYVLGNVQWVHTNVNMMKRSMTQDEFIQVCSDVARTQAILQEA